MKTRVQTYQDLTAGFDLKYSFPIITIGIQNNTLAIILIMMSGSKYDVFDKKPNIPLKDMVIGGTITLSTIKLNKNKPDSYTMELWILYATDMMIPYNGNAINKAWNNFNFIIKKENDCW